MKKDYKKLLIIALIVPLLLAIFKIIFQNDFIYIFKFWITLFLMGAIFYPLTSLIFKSFNDKGWIFSKIIGISASGWLMWILSYARILEYSAMNSYIIIGILLFLNIAIVLSRTKNNKQNNDKIINSKIITNILISEIIFMICFGFWCLTKCYNPQIDNVTEQFMDYGFINSIMNSKYMPPEDIWHSGDYINYYYYGQYISGFICKIANVRANEGYNLINAFLGACSFIMPYTIGFNLLKLKFKNKKKILNIAIPTILAICIGLGTSIGSTMHYPIYRWLDSDKENYYYPDETRYIGFKPETEDKGVTENPAYSNILGDLHAHYIVLIYSFLMIALLLQYFTNGKKYRIRDNLLDIRILMIGFIFGLQKMTNYWDYPIYMVIISSVIVTKHLICGKFEKRNILKTILILVEIMIIQVIVTLPFTLDLKVASTKVFFTEYSSPVYKFAVLWGLQIISILTFFILFLTRYVKSRTLFRKFLAKNKRDLFILIIGICAVGLVILPEIVYLKDIYGDDYRRYNTMFKLTYEAYILFCISVNYIIFKLLIDKNKYLFVFGAVLLILNSSTFGYGIDTLITKNKNGNYIGIAEAESFLKNELPKDYEAINWMNENVDKDKVIVEAAELNNSYSKYSRVSVFTGNPAVIGWMTHEWLWRMNEDYSFPAEIGGRNQEVTLFYNSTNIDTAREFLEKYDVSYIYIGELEYTTYENINTRLLTQLGEIVYKSDDDENPIYIIKV